MHIVARPVHARFRNLVLSVLRKRVPPLRADGVKSSFELTSLGMPRDGDFADIMVFRKPNSIKFARMR